MVPAWNWLQPQEGIPMRKILKVAACLTLGVGFVFGQQPTFHDQLLDHLPGNWVLQGTIAGKDTTHDVTAEWVLGHQYVRIHEVSREKNSQGLPAHEAMVLPQYPAYERMANNDMTVTEWKDKRSYPTYPGYDIDVLDGNGIVCQGNTKLGSVRDSYSEE